MKLSHLESVGQRMPANSLLSPAVSGVGEGVEMTLGYVLTS